MAIKYAPIAIFASGIALGALAQYEIPRIFFPSRTEATWRIEHNEESSHQRIMAFQDVLNNQGPAKDANELTQQIEVQLKIEELIIQSRAAEYASLTPFTSQLLRRNFAHCARELRRWLDRDKAPRTQSLIPSFRPLRTAHHVYQPDVSGRGVISRLFGKWVLA